MENVAESNSLWSHELILLPAIRVIIGESLQPSASSCASTAGAIDSTATHSKMIVFIADILPEAPFSLRFPSRMGVLKLMTYNIKGQAAARRPDHIAKIAEVIISLAPDIVGLQEVHCRTRAAGIDQGEQLAHLAGLNSSFGRSCSLDGGDYGNLVLTRGEILQTEVFPLLGAGEPRSVMQTDVNLDGMRF